MKTMAKFEPAILVFLCIISVLLTPFQLFVDDCRSHGSTLSVILFMCDVVRLLTTVRNGFGGKTTSVLLSFLGLIYAAVDFAGSGQLSCQLVWLNFSRYLYYSCAMKQCSAFRKLALDEWSIVITDATTGIISTAFAAVVYLTTFSCIWYFLGCNLHTNDVTWASRDLEGANPFTKVLLSIYFIVQSSFTIGYGDIVPVTQPETMFAILVIFNSQIILAYLISTTTSFLANKDICRNSYRDEISLINKFLGNRNADHDDIDNIHSYFSYLFERQLGMMETRFLNTLPNYFYHKIVETLASQLTRIPLFQQYPAILRTKCISRMQFRTYAAGSLIFSIGEFKRELYIVRSGRIELYKAEEGKGARSYLVTGDFFGDYYLLFDKPCDIYGKASGFTEVLVLSFDDFAAAVAESNVHSAANALVGRSLIDVVGPDLEHCASVTEKNHADFLERFDKVTASVEKSVCNKRMAMMMKANSIKLNVSGVIMPSNSIRLVWDCLLLIGIFYNLIFVPLRACLAYKCNFSDSQQGSECYTSWTFSLCVDYLVDCVFIVDMILRSRYFAFKSIENDQEQIICNKQEIRQHYMSSMRLKVSLMVIFPLDFCALGAGYLICWRLHSLTSLVLMFEVIPDILDYLSTENQFTVGTEARFVLYLGIITMLSIVWTSLFWDIVHFGENAEDLLSSLYWCLTTMTTTGFGDIIPVSLDQYIFTIFFCVFGVTLGAVIVGNITTYFHRTDVSSNNICHRKQVGLAFISTLSKTCVNIKLGCVSSKTPIKALSSKKSKKSSRVAVLAASQQGETRLFGYSHAKKHRASNSISESILDSISISKNRIHPFFQSGLAEVTPSQPVDVMLIEYFDQLERHKLGIEDQCVFQELIPIHLQNSLKISKIYPFLESNPVFMDCEPSFLRELCLRFTMRLVTCKQVVCEVIMHSDTSNRLKQVNRMANASNQFPFQIAATAPVSKNVNYDNDDDHGKDDECYHPDGMYIINAGTVTMLENNKRNIQKHRGEFIATPFLFDVPNHSHGPFKAKTMTDCEFWFLSKADFQAVIKKYPSVEKFLPEMIHRSTHAQEKRIRKSLSARVLNQMKGLKDISKWLVSPNHWVATLRSALLLLCCLYHGVILPFRIAFMQGYPLSSQCVLDYAGDVLFVADSILQCFFLGFYDKDDLVMQRQSITNRYLSSSSIWYHVISIFPTDLFLLIGSYNPLGPIQMLSLLRLNRLVRLVDYESHLQVIEKRIKASRRFKQCISDNVWRIIKMLVMICFTVHVAGCIFYFIAWTLNHLGMDNWALHAGILLQPPAADLSSSFDLGTQYVFSIYWACQLVTTVGYGDVTPVSSFERLFSIFFFICGTGIFATVIVYVQDVVAQLDVTADIYKTRCAAFKNFVLRECESLEFRNKCLSHLERQWCLFRGVPGGELSAYFPDHIYAKTVFLSIQEQLSELFFVSKCSVAFQKAFATKMIARQYAKGDFVFRCGEMCTTLHFLAAGEIALVDDDEIFEVSHLVNSRVSRGPSTLVPAASRNPLNSSGKESDGGPVNRRSSLASAGSNIFLSSPHLISQDPATAKKKSSSAFSRSNLNATLGNSPSRTPIHSDSLHSHSGPGHQQQQSSHHAAQPSYANIVDGVLSEYEFFTRAFYACGATAMKECIVFEVDYDTFRDLLIEFGLEECFLESLNSNLKKLYCSSTEGAVKKIHDNLLASNKIMKMLAASLPTEENRAIFHPHSTFTNCWEAVTLVFILYVAFSVPYCFAFECGWTIVGFDVLLLVFSVANIYLRSNMMAVIEEGQLIDDPEVFSVSYVRQHLLIDAVLSLPIAIITAAVTGAFGKFVICRCMLLVMLAKFNTNVNRNLEAIERLFKMQISVETSKVMKCLCIVWFLGHCSCCCLCLIGLFEFMRGQKSWVEENGFEGYSSFDLYIRGYYWGIYTIVTVGYGNIALPSCNEKLFAIVVMIIGSVLCNAGVAAVFSSIVSEQDKLNGVTRRANEATLKFCVSNGVDMGLQSSLKSYFQYRHDKLNNSTESQDFELLSPALKLEFVLHTCRHPLMDVLPVYVPSHMFQEDVRQGFLLSLCRIATFYTAIPGEVLYDSLSKKNLHHFDLFVNRRGSLSYKSNKTGQTVQKHGVHLLWPEQFLSTSSIGGHSSSINSNNTSHNSNTSNLSNADAAGAGSGGADGDEHPSCASISVIMPAMTFRSRITSNNHTTVIQSMQKRRSSFALFGTPLFDRTIDYRLAAEKDDNHKLPPLSLPSHLSKLFKTQVDPTCLGDRSAASATRSLMEGCDYFFRIRAELAATTDSTSSLGGTPNACVVVYESTATTAVVVNSEGSKSVECHWRESVQFKTPPNCVKVVLDVLEICDPETASATEVLGSTVLSFERRQSASTIDIFEIGGSGGGDNVNSRQKSGSRKDSIFSFHSVHGDNSRRSSAVGSSCSGGANNDTECKTELDAHEQIAPKAVDRHTLSVFSAGDNDASSKQCIGQLQFSMQIRQLSRSSQVESLLPSHFAHQRSSNNSSLNGIHNTTTSTNTVNESEPETFTVTAESYCHMFVFPVCKVLEILEFYRLTQLHHCERFHSISRRSSIKSVSSRFCSARQQYHPRKGSSTVVVSSNNTMPPSLLRKPSLDAGLSYPNTNRAMSTHNLFDGLSSPAGAIVGGGTVVGGGLLGSPSPLGSPPKGYLMPNPSIGSDLYAANRLCRRSLCGDIELLQVLQEKQGDDDDGGLEDDEDNNNGHSTGLDENGRGFGEESDDGSGSTATGATEQLQMIV